MTANKRLWLLGGATAAIVAAAAVPAVAQNQYEDTVDLILDLIEVAANEEGFVETHFRHGGQLAAGEVELATIDLDADTGYMILASCDEDCSDIDLAIYDEDGDLVDQDVGDDDMPGVGVVPAYDGRYTVEVTMVSCDEEPCYYGIGAFGR